MIATTMKQFQMTAALMKIHLPKRTKRKMTTPQKIRIHPAEKQKIHLHQEIQIKDLYADSTWKEDADMETHAGMNTLRIKSDPVFMAMIYRDKDMTTKTDPILMAIINRHKDTTTDKTKPKITGLTQLATTPVCQKTQLKEYTPNLHDQTQINGCSHKTQIIFHH